VNEGYYFAAIGSLFGIKAIVETSSDYFINELKRKNQKELITPF